MHTLEPDEQVRTDELRIVEDLLELARSRRPGDTRRLPFADHVALGLGSQLHGQLAATDAHRPAAWRLNVGFYFAGHVGPFSALTTLRVAPTDVFTVSTGSHPRCAGGPPIAAPAAVAEHRHIAVQPGDIESCLDWFSVDLFLDRHGRISAVTLDLWDP